MGGRRIPALLQSFSHPVRFILLLSTQITFDLFKQEWIYQANKLFQPVFPGQVSLILLPASSDPLLDGPNDVSTHDLLPVAGGPHLGQEFFEQIGQPGTTSLQERHSQDRKSTRLNSSHS